MKLVVKEKEECLNLYNQVLPEQKEECLNLYNQVLPEHIRFSYL